LFALLLLASIITQILSKPNHSYFSFWLPTPTDKFYPDFVAVLDDDKTLVVEYQGDLSKESDNREKIAVGKLWAERSNGQCLFLFVLKENFESKLRAVAG